VDDHIGGSRCKGLGGDMHGGVIESGEWIITRKVGQERKTH
jgi:hypothetical protein